MAITNSPRLGIERWSHGTDRHPPRAVWDAQQAILDDLVAIDRQYATLADRPAAGVRGTYCWVEETGILYRDDGSQWRPIVQFGGGAGAAVVVGGSGSEGTSSRTARADHSHPLPLVTSSAHGAMRKEDKALLDAATHISNASAIVRRSSDNSFAVRTIYGLADPTGADHAARKGYVDGLVGGVHVPTTIPPTANLDAYTTSGVYVQNQHTSAQSGTNYPVPYAGLLTVNTSANFVFQEYAVTRLAPGGDVVYRRTRYDGSWGAWAQSAPRSYVDAGDAAAEAALAPVKDAVEAATSSAVAEARLVKRDATGRYQAVSPARMSDVANMQFVESRTNNRLPFGGPIVDQVDQNFSINAALTPGQYQGGTGATITDRGYPIDGNGGSLLVLPIGSSASERAQVWTDRMTGRVFTRITRSGSSGWTAWWESASTALATTSAAGLMPSGDRAALNASTSLPTGGTLAKRDAAGRIRAADPVAAQDVANMGFVQSAASAAQSAAETTAASALAPVEARLVTVETDLAEATNLPPAWNETSNKLVRRNSAGQAQFPWPSNPSDVATMGYVDGQKVSSEQTDLASIQTGWTVGELYYVKYGSVITVYGKDLKFNATQGYKPVGRVQVSNHRPPLSVWGRATGGRDVRIDPGGWVYVYDLTANENIPEFSITYVMP